MVLVGLDPELERLFKGTRGLKGELRGMSLGKVEKPGFVGLVGLHVSGLIERFA